MYYTLNYTNDCGDTVARDYFEDVEKAKDFMKEYTGYHGLILEDSDGRIIKEYYPPYPDDEY
jgi:hypothetical protein